LNKYYEKESVSGACISEENRIAMLRVLIDQLNARNLPFAEFKVGDFNIRRGKKTRKSVPLFESLKLLERANKTNPKSVYIVLRQHTFESILKNRLPASDRLLANYNFVVLPTDESVLYDLQLETRLLDGIESMAKEMYGLNIRDRIIFVSPRQQHDERHATANRWLH
jgi:hypothetical protein